MAMPPMQPIIGTTIRDRVYEQLRGAILDGTFRPGLRLDLSELTESFGVSKTPLTEAVQRLIREGLITVKPRSGTFVSELGPEDIHESFGFRGAIEIGAAEMIVESITDDEISQLRKLNDQMRVTLSNTKKLKGARTEFLHIDIKFHDIIIMASRNSLIFDHFKQVNTLLMVMRIRSLYTIEQYQEALQEHDNIIDALASRDAATFIQNSRTHLNSGERKMLAATRKLDDSEPVS